MISKISKVKVSEKEKLFGYLAKCGFKRNCEDWHEYERAKQLIFGDEWDPKYYQKIEWITEYLGL